MRYDKLSPTLAVLLDDFNRGGRAGLRVHRQQLGLVSVEPMAKPPRVVMFVHLAPDADSAGLARLGVELNGGHGHGVIRTGIVALDDLDRLTEDPAVRLVVPARPLRLLMDVAPAAVRLPEFRAASGLTGRGVIVGIVDSGIQVDHPSFTGRIHRLWDQTLNGRGVPEGRYGVELLPSMQHLSRDTIGHGTHVAGIAGAADEVYPGVAPEAELVVVKSDLLTAHIADGIRYVFRIASETGGPAVVNLSLGGHGDSHDGADSLSAVIEEAVGPGRIVCCAAGNEGNDNIHAQVLLRQDRTRTISCVLRERRGNEAAFAAVFNGWYSGQDALAVAVVSPSDEQTPFQPVVTAGSPVRDYSLPEGSVRVITPGPDPSNGDHNFLVLVEPAAKPAPAAASPVASGAWRLRLQGTRVTKGTADLWSVDPSVAQFSGRTVVDSMKIGSPGAATSAVTVASFTTKVEWQDMFGQRHQSGLELDDISDFSSEGPRRDGVEKPEVAAPGAMIAAALSVHSGVAHGALVDDRHAIMAGTSMATPFVSGLVALLLERDPELDPEGIKELLRRNSAIPGHAAGSYQPKWGYGLIDAGEL